MTIEFPCPQCNQVVRTPDAAAGKKGKCPGCQTVVQIPAAKQTAPAAAKPIAKSAPQPAAPLAEHTGPIEFFCTFCGQVVRTPRAAAGKKGKCPHCSEVVLIPLTNPPKPAAAAAAPKPPAPKQEPILKKATPLSPPAAKSVTTAPTTKKPAVASSAPPALQPLAPLTPLDALTPLSSGGDLFGGPAAAPQRAATPALVPLVPLAPLSPLGESSAANGGDLFGGSPLPANNAAQPFAPLVPLGAAPAGGDLFGSSSSFGGSPFGERPVSSKPLSSATTSDASLNIPAIIQLVVVIPFALCYLLYFGLCVLSCVFTGLGMAAAQPQLRSLLMSALLSNVMWTVITLVFMVGQVVIIFGSIRQLERKGLQMAQIGAWLAVVPCLSPMGMPAAIWSLVGLYRDDVKRTFRS